MQTTHGIAPQGMSNHFLYTVALLILFTISQGKYLEWADKNRFQSMLPKDTQRRRNTAAAAAAASEQTRLDSHLKELPPKERVVPYTDDLFCHAAMEWLVSTDQVSGLYYTSSVAYEFNNSQFRRFSTQPFKK